VPVFLNANVIAVAVSSALFLPTVSSAQTQISPGLWYVYYDGVADKAHQGHGFWTNVMPKACGEEMRTTIVEDYKEDKQSGQSSLKIRFIYPPEQWCGVAVASKEDYWGETPGPSFDMQGYKRLVFWARGEKGGEVIQVKVGIAGDKPFGDSTKIALSTPRIRLDRKWTEYSLDLDAADEDLKRIITPFVVVSSQSYNPGDDSTSFYIDNVYYAK
jgi:hypothetical protein